MTSFAATSRPTAGAARCFPCGCPERPGRAYRAGSNLSLTDADTGKRTWEKFLAERVG